MSYDDNERADYAEHENAQEAEFRRQDKRLCLAYLAAPVGSAARADLHKQITDLVGDDADDVAAWIKSYA